MFDILKNYIGIYRNLPHLIPILILYYINRLMCIYTLYIMNKFLLFYKNVWIRLFAIPRISLPQTLIRICVLLKISSWLFTLRRNLGNWKIANLEDTNTYFLHFLSWRRSKDKRNRRYSSFGMFVKKTVCIFLYPLH